MTAIAWAILIYTIIKYPNPKLSEPAGYAAMISLIAIMMLTAKELLK